MFIGVYFFRDVNGSAGSNRTLSLCAVVCFCVIHVFVVPLSPRREYER